MILREALRSLARAPVSMATASLTLGVSMAVALAVFSVADGVLFRPLPYRDADRLVELVKVTSVGSRELSMRGMTWAELEYWRGARHIFGAMAAYKSGRPVADADGDFTNAILLGKVTPQFLELVGIRPMLGRGFSVEGGRPGDNAILISEEYWRRSLGGQEQIVGRTLRIGAAAYTVVGVMPRILKFHVAADAWVPVSERARGGDSITVMARLQKGLSLETAQRWVNEFSGWRGSASRETTQWHVVPIADLRASGHSRPAVLALVGGTGILLVLGCTTVAGLLLVRTVRRSHELATKLALGATRGHLFCHVVADLFLLGSMSTTVCFFGVWFLLSLLPRLVPPALAAWLFEAYVPRIDMRLATFLLVGTTAAVFACGWLPTRWVLGLADSALLGGERGLARREIRRRTAQILQGMQVGAATALLLAAGLLFTAYARLVTEYPGYDPHQFVYEGCRLPRPQFPTKAAQEQALRELQRQLEDSPVVGRVSFGSAPLRVSYNDIRTEDDTVEMRVCVGDAWAGYFDVVGAYLLDGRTFGEQDIASAPRVAVVDKRVADRFWPGRRAVGQRFYYGVNAELTTVVGVVATISRGIERIGGTVYLPLSQQTAIWGTDVVARIPEGVSAQASLDAIRAAARRLSFQVEVRGTGSDLRTKTLVEPRFYLALAALPALTSALVAMLGFYGLLSELALSRRREMAVRVAVGATPMRLWRFSVGAAVGPLVAGLSVGVVVGLWSSSGLAAVLYETSPYDPVTFLVVPSLWGATAFAMVAISASGSNRLDVVELLRQA